MKTSIKIVLSLAIILPLMAMTFYPAPLTEVNQLPVGDDDIEAGKALYTAKACFACHGMNGEGNQLGPNMTDDYFKHGCSEEDIVKVITKGVAGTAMVPYGTQMKAEEIKQLAKYVMSLRGSNPANAKAPEGEKCE